MDNQLPTAQSDSSVKEEQVVVFLLEGEEYAAPILEVQEIIPTGEITQTPNVPDHIDGIINVRGTVATVINLARRFKLTQKDPEHAGQYIILCSSHGQLFGMRVDEVRTVIKLSQNNIRSAQTGEHGSRSEFIKEVAVVDDRIILILDVTEILSGEVGIQQAETATPTPAAN